MSGSCSADLQHDIDPDMLGLVRDVLAQPPMRPARHFLIDLMTQGHAVGYVPHVADDDLACTPRHRMIDHGAADLVQDVRSRRSCWALKRLICCWMRLRLFDPLLSSRKEANSDRRLLPYCLQALSARQESTRACSVSAMTARLIRPCRPPAPGRQGRWRHKAIFEHHVPSVLVGLLVEHKPGFQNSTGLPVCRDRHRDRSQAPSSRAAGCCRSYGCPGSSRSWYGSLGGTRDIWPRCSRSV